MPYIYLMKSILTSCELPPAAEAISLGREKAGRTEGRLMFDQTLLMHVTDGITGIIFAIRSAKDLIFRP
jgi:hypothetical protein